MKTLKIKQFILHHTTGILFVLLFLMFGLIAPRFLTLKNFENILGSASYIGILAVGMTFVLLTGGIDISVGSTMYLSAVVFGLLLNNLELPFLIALTGSLLVGAAVGLFNAFTITRLKLAPFIATLITMSIGHGIALFITKSKSVNFPDSITMMSTVKVFGFIPLQVFIFSLLVIVASVYLRKTKPGRQLYAVGNSADSAEKAGIKSQPLIAHVYIISGVLAALAGFVSITQIGRVNSNFGSGDEFDAIAAAVLGGASLFGGIGTVFPGTVLGTIMIQMIQAGLIFADIDIYIQPLVMAGIIFFAVFLDSMRNIEIKKLERRNIMKI
ncbi:MAG: ABC transporter permease [Bacteroidales bacterium]|nr:ABC transporter permease [Bacteroidales bacterium]